MSSTATTTQAPPPCAACTLRMQSGLDSGGGGTATHPSGSGARSYQRAMCDAEPMRALVRTWIDQIQRVSPTEEEMVLRTLPPDATSERLVASREALVSFLAGLVDAMYDPQYDVTRFGAWLNDLEQENRRMWRSLYADVSSSAAPPCPRRSVVVAAGGGDRWVSPVARSGPHTIAECAAHCGTAQAVYARFIAPFVAPAVRTAAEATSAFVRHLVAQHYLLYDRATRPPPSASSSPGTDTGRNGGGATGGGSERSNDSALFDYDAAVASLRWLLSEHLYVRRIELAVEAGTHAGEIVRA